MESTRFGSPIGIVEVSCTANGISGIVLGLPGHASSESNLPNSLLMEATRQMLQYFAGKRMNFDLPLDWNSIHGFQRDVLTVTADIPFGHVLTYRQIAEKLGRPTASRAVGGALGRNPIPILIPCHRVVAADGSLCGYSAADGIKTKAWLLSLEEHTVVGKKLV